MLYKRSSYAARAAISVTNASRRPYYARPHRARIVDEFLRKNNVDRMVRPAISPDLSRIEHV